MIKSTFNKYWIYFFAAILLLSHLPFLSADPSDAVSWSRGPWTDEGQYLVQIRNVINTGNFDISEVGTFVGAPFFNFLMYPIFLLFGTKLIVARCIVMLITIATFLFILKKRGSHPGWIFTIILFASQFYIFQYSHFAQAELLQCDFILLALFFYIKQKESTIVPARKTYWNIFLSCLFISLSFWTKINTAYLLALLPMTFGIELFISLFSKSNDKRFIFYKFLVSIGFTIALVIIYILLWYLPNSEIFSLFSSNSLSSATGFKLSFEDYKTLFLINYKNLILDDSLMLYVYLTILALLIMIGIMVYKWTRLSIDKVTNSPLVFIFLFFLIEMHKFGYHYLPSRYLIPTILSACCMIGFVFEQISGNRTLKTIAILLCIIILGSNAVLYSKAFNNRNYKVQEMNDYLARYDLKNETIIGSWAPSATWKCKSRALPIWNDYSYHDDPINTFHPRIIISELDETDSDSAYSRRGINLNEISDSTKQFDIHLWKPVIYWLKKN